ncbi:winged helix-turn-helix domain-containing protein [Lysobacter sp. CA199]|uniref:winged helix-turn-helix domain-containing protein n=1 Tax=Lysobacter sp. CA199 TaxID=3455608 RepID=UPI003F8D373A
MISSWPSDARYLRLADLTVDLRFRRLIHTGQNVELPQRIFDLLLLFLAEPDQLHTRTELFDRLWSGTIVEDTNLSQNIWLLRKALGEQRKSWIQTVAKSGYVFQAPEPVQWFKELPAATEPAEQSGGAPIEQFSELEPGSMQGMVATSSLEAIEPTHGARPRRRVWLLALVAMAVIAIAVAWFLHRRLVPAESQLTVALVVIEDENLATRWPAELLHQWLYWKLGSLPGVNLRDEAQLAAGDAPASA